jgi:hypothetical protein
MNTGAGKKIEIGENTIFVANDNLDSPIRKANNVIIASNSTLIAYNHKFHKGYVLLNGQANNCHPIIIYEIVCIRSNVSVTPGVQTGVGMTICLGSVVTKDVPANVFVNGKPSRIFSCSEKDRYQRLVSEAKYLNKIRGSLIIKFRYINKYKNEYKTCLERKGYSLSSDINEELSLRSFLFNKVDLIIPGTEIGNAGKENINIMLQEKPDLSCLAREIINDCVENHKLDMEKLIIQDQKDLLEAYE